MTYVFDLDGTLCHTIGMEYAAAQPMFHRIRRVNDLYDKGHTIVIDTARGTTSGADQWWDLTRQQLEQWGVKHHKLHLGTKPFGDVYVDDRAVEAYEFFNARTDH